MRDQKTSELGRDKIEDLAPRENESAELKGGPTSVHGGGGGAGQTACADGKH